LVFPGALGDFLCFLPTLKCVSERERGFDLEVAMRSDFSELIFPWLPGFGRKSPPIFNLETSFFVLFFITSHRVSLGEGEARKVFNL